MAEDTKKNILFIMQLPPPVHGVSIMNKLIHESAYINQAFHCDFVNLTTARNINDLGKGAGSKLISFFSIYKQARQLMRKRRYGYVYITLFPYGLAFWKDALIVLLAKRLKQRVLIHNHVLGLHEAGHKNGFRKWFYRRVFRDTEMICLSPRLTSDLDGLFDGKIHILPNGIDQVNFENTYEQEQLPLSILYLSNLIRTKGILILLDALELLKKKGVVIPLRVAGAESDITYAELEQVVRTKDLQAQVTLLGPRYGDEKWKEFRQAGLFVLASSADTFGLVLLEAMQFGVPCISTRVGGIPDVLGDGRGYILPHTDASSLADAIEALATHPEMRRQMSRASFDYYSHHYTTAVFERRLAGLLNTGKISQHTEP